MNGYQTIDWPGWVSLSEGEARTEMNIVLACGGAVSGTVRGKAVHYDESRISNLFRTVLSGDRKREEAAFAEFVREDNRPLSGVRITLEDVADTPSACVIRDAVTDESGHYELPECPAGKYVVKAYPPDYAVVMVERHASRYREISIAAVQDLRDVDFSFRLDSMAVAGRVTDTQGEPIPGARLTAEQLVHDRGDGMTRVPDSGKVAGVTNDEGMYRLSGLAPPHIMEALGFVWSNGESGGDFSYRLRGRATGYVTSEVVVPPVSGTLARTARMVLEQGAKAGVHEMSERPIPKASGDLLRYGSRGAIQVDMVLARDASICGRLVDTRGKAMAKASLRMSRVEPLQEEPRLLTIQQVIPDPVTVDEDGLFEISGIPAGRFVFQAEIPAIGLLHARNEPLDLRSGDTIRNLELIVESADERGDITGTVRDAITNKPIPDFAVAVFRVDSPLEPHPRHGDVTVDGAKNTFMIRGVSPGVATLQVSAPGYPPSEAQARVESGKTSNAAIQLPPEGFIEGIMTLNGVPASGRVSVRLASGPKALESAGGDTNAEGEFSVPGLSPGEYLVRADALVNPGPPPSYRYSWTKANVVAGRATRVKLNVEGSATIRGNFTFPETYKYSWIQVYEGHVPAFSPMEDEEAAWRLVRATADLSGQSGPYEITNLSPGTYTVIALCFGRKDKTGAAYERDRRHVSHLVTIGDGEEHELNLEIETPP